MKKDNYEQKRNEFAVRYSSKPVDLPLQEVKPAITPTSQKEEQQLNVWIPKALMKRLKMKGIEENKSLKEIVTEALGQFL